MCDCKKNGETLTDEQRQNIAFAMSFIAPTTQHRRAVIDSLRALLSEHPTEKAEK